MAGSPEIIEEAEGKQNSFSRSSLEMMGLAGSVIGSTFAATNTAHREIKEQAKLYQETVNKVGTALESFELIDQHQPGRNQTITQLENIGKAESKFEGYKAGLTGHEAHRARWGDYRNDSTGYRNESLEKFVEKRIADFQRMTALDEINKAGITVDESIKELYKRAYGVDEKVLGDPARVSSSNHNSAESSWQKYLDGNKVSRNFLSDAQHSSSRHIDWHTTNSAPFLSSREEMGAKAVKFLNEHGKFATGGALALTTFAVTGALIGAGRLLFPSKTNIQ